MVATHIQPSLSQQHQAPELDQFLILLVLTQCIMLQWLTPGLDMNH